MELTPGDLYKIIIQPESEGADATLDFTRFLFYPYEDLIDQTHKFIMPQKNVGMYLFEKTSQGINKRTVLCFLFGYTKFYIEKSDMKAAIKSNIIIKLDS